MTVGTIIHRFESVPSTNDAARALVLEGAPHGTAVLAREQTRAGAQRGGAGIRPPAWDFMLRSSSAVPAAKRVPFPHILPLAAGLAAVRRRPGGERGRGPAQMAERPRPRREEARRHPDGRGFRRRRPAISPSSGSASTSATRPADFPESLRATSTSLKLAGSPETTVEGLFRALCPALDRWYNVLARGDKEAVIGAFEARPVFPPGTLVRVETP